MSEYFESPLLGKVRVPTEEEVMTIEMMANECTLATFQALNKRLNCLGMQVTIDELPKK